MQVKKDEEKKPHQKDSSVLESISIDVLRSFWKSRKMCRVNKIRGSSAISGTNTREHVKKKKKKRLQLWEGRSVESITFGKRCTTCKWLDGRYMAFEEGPGFLHIPPIGECRQSCRAIETRTAEACCTVSKKSFSCTPHSTEPNVARGGWSRFTEEHRSAALHTLEVLHTHAHCRL